MKEKLKQIIHYVSLILMLVIGIFMGYFYNKLTPTPITKINPYTQIHYPKDISIAINEKNDLLMITKKTGDYIIYSDSIGFTIFKMYANKIYKETTETEK